MPASEQDIPTDRIAHVALVPPPPRTRRGALAAGALAVLALGLLWTTQAVTATERFDEVHRRDPWAERGNFTVDGIGEPGLLTTLHPVLDVGFGWRAQDPRAERVTALGVLEVRVDAPAGPGREAWSHQEELASATLAGHASDPLELRASLDLPDLRARLKEAHPAWDGEATWTLAAVVRFATAPTTEHKSDGSEFLLPFTYDDPLVVLPPASQAETVKDHTVVDTTTREESMGFQGLLARPAGPLALVAGVAGLLALRARDDEEAHA